MSTTKRGPFFLVAFGVANVAAGKSILSLDKPIQAIIAHGPFETEQDIVEFAEKKFPASGYKVAQCHLVIAEATGLARAMPPPPLEFVPLERTDTPA